MRKELERIEIPGEHEARVRTWEVVRAAFAEREPVPRRARLVRPVLVLAALAALAAAALSPPGQAVIDRVREAIGVEDAEEALFSLPAGGRLLVESAEGPWIVQPDGSKRRLGDYREASWSPFGRFVVVARRNELAALEPDGDVRWSLARPVVRFPRWWGTRADTLIAYLSRESLRLVAGDGRGDRVLDPSAAPVAPAWRPGFLDLLAYVDSDGTVRILDVRARRVLASRRLVAAAELLWSPSGHVLAVRSRTGVAILRPDGRRLAPVAAPSAAAAMAFDPRERLTLASHDRSGARYRVTVAGRTLFTGAGSVDGIAWSPDGRWLLVGWSAADQWIFVHRSGKQIEAVSNISEQFGGSFPRVAGWCCPR